MLVRPAEKRAAQPREKQTLSCPAGPRRNWQNLRGASGQSWLYITQIQTIANGKLHIIGDWQIQSHDHLLSSWGHFHRRSFPKVWISWAQLEGVIRRLQKQNVRMLKMEISESSKVSVPFDVLSLKYILEKNTNYTKTTFTWITAKKGTIYFLSYIYPWVNFYWSYYFFFSSFDSS